MARDVYLRDASLALRGLVLIQLIGTTPRPRAPARTRAGDQNR